MARTTMTTDMRYWLTKTQEEARENNYSSEYGVYYDITPAFRKHFPDGMLFMFKPVGELDGIQYQSRTRRADSFDEVVDNLHRFSAILFIKHCPKMLKPTINPETFELSGEWAWQEESYIISGVMKEEVQKGLG